MKYHANFSLLTPPSYPRWLLMGRKYLKTCHLLRFCWHFRYSTLPLVQNLFIIGKNIGWKWRSCTTPFFCFLPCFCTNQRKKARLERKKDRRKERKVTEEAWYFFFCLLEYHFLFWVARFSSFFLIRDLNLNFMDLLDINIKDFSRLLPTRHLFSNGIQAPHPLYYW